MAYFESNKVSFEIQSQNLSTYTLPPGGNTTIATLPAGDGVYLVSVDFRLNSGTFNSGIIVSPDTGIIQNSHDYGSHFCIVSGGTSITVYNYGSSLSLHDSSKIRYVKLS